MSKGVKTAPDFMCIGMQKAGTSWLHEQLKTHPDVWLPKRKELHFFDSLKNPQWNAKRQSRALKNIPDLVSKIEVASEEEQREYQNELAENVHFAKPINDIEWYREFWRTVSPQDKLVGEITPAYSILKPDVIQLIKSDVGVNKVILILRNPVDRAWSQYKMMTERKANDPETVYKKRKLLDRGRAKRILRNWETAYDSEHLFIGFYDDIKEKPYWFLEQVCGFLGVGYQADFFPNAATAVRVSREEECPQHIFDFFLSEYSSDLKYLANRFQGHASKWSSDLGLTE
jgi:hypothetical protein